VLTLEKALEMMKKTTHLSMTVRANRMGFKEAILFAQQLHSQLSPQQQQDGIETGTAHNHAPISHEN
jgi:hypothetical protein